MPLLLPLAAAAVLMMFSREKAKSDKAETTVEEDIINNTAPGKKGKREEGIASLSSRPSFSHQNNLTTTNDEEGPTIVP